MKQIDERVLQVNHEVQTAEIACQRLRIAFTHTGHKSSDVAHLVGFSEASVQVWVIANARRQRKPMYSNLKKISEAIGTPMSFLCNADPYRFVDTYPVPENWRSYVSRNRAVFAQRVKIAMAASGTTPASLARTAGVSRFAIDAWCACTAAPQDATIEKFSKGTGAPLKWLAVPLPVGLS